MAETATAAQFPTSSEFQRYWDEMVAANPVKKIDYTPVQVEEVTADSAGQQIQSWLNPYVDKSVKARQATTKANQAELAADAYSRGMGASTWLSDQNRRQFDAESADVSNIRSNAAMTLAQGIADELTNYRTRKLQADTTNAATRAQVDAQNLELEEALKNQLWSRFIDQFNMGLYSVPKSGGGGGGGGGGDGGLTIDLASILGESSLTGSGIGFSESMWRNAKNGPASLKKTNKLIY